MQIRRRKDVDPNDGIRKYGDVEFADPVNNKYPIDTVDHIRGAWARIHMSRNAMFYSQAELDLIKERIIKAAKKFGIQLSEELVERDAKLFTAGEYPDRGIEITEDDLDRMVESHLPVPIKIEHVDSPLELGMVTKLWRTGRDLFGRLVFTAPAWNLIQSSQAKKLSAALKRDKSGLVEVSLVRNPRVAGAVIFGSDNNQVIEFSFEIDNGGEEMSESKTVEFSKRIADLERELKSRQVDGQIDALKRAGKLAPASEDIARALLLAGDSQVVTFSDGSEKPVAETFLAFLESQPKVVEFSELTEGGNEASEASEAEKELFSKLGITPESAAKYKGR
ncbi:MAG TPA: hypothetical protein PLZ21_09115 [Armatimonadota bacterium]|jgi:hypothetical protein|nr:hypothetical protein [Armatimonadota bacterium]